MLAVGYSALTPSYWDSGLVERPELRSQPRTLLDVEYQQGHGVPWKDVE